MVAVVMAVRMTEVSISASKPITSSISFAYAESATPHRLTRARAARLVHHRSRCAVLHAVGGKPADLGSGARNGSAAGRTRSQAGAHDRGRRDPARTRRRDPGSDRSCLTRPLP